MKFTFSQVAAIVDSRTDINILEKAELVATICQENGYAIAETNDVIGLTLFNALTEDNADTKNIILEIEKMQHQLNNVLDVLNKL